MTFINGFQHLRVFVPSSFNTLQAEMVGKQRPEIGHRLLKCMDVFALNLGDLVRQIFQGSLPKYNHVALLATDQMLGQIIRR